MIRAAKFTDIPRIVDLLEEMQAASKYAGVVNVDRKVAQALVQQCVTRHGGLHDGGALVMVADTDGAVVGFMIGLLDRVYHIGDKLCANDMYLYAAKDCRARDMTAMVDAYLTWGETNPKVHEIKLSWTDTLPGANRIASLYERRGFSRCGEIFVRAARPIEGEIAA